jgi:hypothetical protein
VLPEGALWPPKAGMLEPNGPPGALPKPGALELKAAIEGALPPPKPCALEPKAKLGALPPPKAGVEPKAGTEVEAGWDSTEPAANPVKGLAPKPGVGPAKPGVRGGAPKGPGAAPEGKAKRAGPAVEDCTAGKEDVSWVAPDDAPHAAKICQGSG